MEMGYYAGTLIYTNLYGDKYVEMTHGAVRLVSIKESQTSAIDILHDLEDRIGKNGRTSRAQVRFNPLSL